MGEFFSNLIGTLAVIIVISEIISSSTVIPRVLWTKRDWKSILLAGLIGGLFGIYANLSGVPYKGAFITVRDTGPILAGYMAGPFGGFIAGVICGVHRYTMGGITAVACIAATCLIGFFSGFFFDNRRGEAIKVSTSLKVGAFSEMGHLLMVLLLVEPFDTALDIVKTIAIPFILVNSFGFTLMIQVMKFIETQKKMQSDQDKLDTELETAKNIQRSLLPPITEDYPCKSADNKFSIATYIEPAKKVGGDFYDFFYIDKTHFAFLIADVSGKGIPAAMFMATSKMILQNCLRDISDFSEAVEMANERMCVNNDAGMFVTSWIGILDLETMALKYVNAGHNPPILFRDNKSEYLRNKNSFILAGMEGMKYKVNDLQLNKGDIIYLYTDGVSEADNKDEELYGEARLEKCLNKLSDPDADEVINAVNKSLDKFVNGHEQFDDITMLALKIN